MTMQEFRANEMLVKAAKEMFELPVAKLLFGDENGGGIMMASVDTHPMFQGTFANVLEHTDAKKLGSIEGYNRYHNLVRKAAELERPRIEPQERFEPVKIEE